MKKLFTVLMLLIATSSIAQIKRDTITDLSPILVTSVRADSKIPITQKTLSASDIQNGYQGQEIPMILGNLPSVYSNSDGGHAMGYSYFSLRGIDQTRVNLTLNGIPLNEPEDLGCYTSNYPSFINSIHSIQMQRGVGTSSNGASSFAGSINFQTKDGLEKGTELQLGWGSFNTARFNVSTSTGLSKKGFALFTNIGGVRTDGFRDNSGSRGGSAFVSAGHYSKRSVTKINVFTGISENQMAFEGETDSTLNVNFKTNHRGLDNMDYFNQTHIQLQHIQNFTSSVKWSTTAFYNHLKGHYDVYGLKTFDVDGYYAAEQQSSDWRGVISQIDFRTSDIKTSAGISYNNYVRWHDGYDTIIGLRTNYSNSGKKNDLSGFIKFSYDNRKVLIYADAQIRQVGYNYSGSDTSFNKSWLFFNPKIGVKYFLNNKINIYWGAGISHREPTRSVFLQGNLYTSTGYFTDAKSEQVIDNEIGVNYKGKKLKLQANAYLMVFNNEIIPIGKTGGNSLPVMVNTDKSVRYGIELDGEYQIINNLTYCFTTTLSKSEFKDSSRVRTHLYSPSVLIMHSLNYTKGNWSFNVNHNYYSEVYLDKDNNFTAPVASTVGANVSYDFKKINISVQGNNITNERVFYNGCVKNNTRYMFANALANYYVTLRIKL
jgi:iron complex outermembrane receptor protein